MSLFVGLSVNTLFEQLSGELLQARYENARFKSIKDACTLVLRDEARHIQFGRIIMRRFFEDLSAQEKQVIGANFQVATGPWLQSTALERPTPIPKLTSFAAALRRFARTLHLTV